MELEMTSKVIKSRVGIFILLGLIAVGLITWFCIAHTFGSSYSLEVYLPEAYELTSGARVTLAGMPVGYVQDLRLVNQSIEAMHNPHLTVEATLRIDNRDQAFIRSDSVATIETEGLLGYQYVAVSRGVVGAPLADKSQLAFRPPTSINFGKFLNSLVDSNQKESSKAKTEEH